MPQPTELQAAKDYVKRLVDQFTRPRLHLSEFAVYTGAGAHALLFKGKVKFEKYEYLSKNILDWANSQGLRNQTKTSTLLVAGSSHDKMLIQEGARIQRTPPARTLAGLAMPSTGLEEGHEVEFKGSIETDMNRLFLGDGKREKNDDLRTSILKTIIAFVNSMGGTLVIGALEKEFYSNCDRLAGKFPELDELFMIGIEEELGFKNWGKYLEHLRNLIRDRINPASEIGHWIEIKKEVYEGKTIAMVHVGCQPASPFMLYDLDDTVYYRADNTTQILRANEFDGYKISRAASLH